MGRGRMGLLGGAVGRRGGSGKTEPRLRLRGRGGRRGFGVAVDVPGVIQDRVGGEAPVLDVEGGPAMEGENFGLRRDWVRERVRGREMLGRRCATSGALCSAWGEERMVDCVMALLSSSSVETRGNGMHFL